MNNSGDAAEQIVRMSLEGVEFAARITGTAAKELALLIITALKNDKDKGHLKLRGKERLKSMLKSGKPLEIYSIKERDLARFAKGAKEYGIVYCVLRNTRSNPDGLCDLMVRADDAPKIARVAERFKFGMVDKAKIEREIIEGREKAADAPEVEGTAPTGQEPPDKGDTEKLVDDLLGSPEGKAGHDLPESQKRETSQTKAEPVKPGAEAAESRPLATGGQKRSSSQSALTSGHRKNSERDSSSKPSVREEIREIKASRKTRESDSPRRDDRAVSEKPKSNPTITHKQPPRGGRSKTTKSKGNR